MQTLVRLIAAASLVVGLAACGYQEGDRIATGAGTGAATGAIIGAVAFAAYGLSHVSDSIWKGQPWSNTVRALVDGTIYAVLTAVTFRLLWPSA